MIECTIVHTLKLYAMKKISLKSLKGNHTHQLSAEEMKGVLGGAAPTTPDCRYAPSCTSRCARGNYCSTCCNA